MLSAQPECFSNGAGVVSPGQLLRGVNSEEAAAADSPLCPPACCFLESTLGSVVKLLSWHQDVQQVVERLLYIVHFKIIVRSMKRK